MLRVTLRSKNFCRNFQIDPQVDYRTGHPKKYPIRRKDNRQRFLYQKYKEEILMDQITQPHYPSSHKNPDYAQLRPHPLSTRHLEANRNLGPDNEATELYGPDKLELERLRETFEKCKNGIIGILLHAGDAGFTMDEHVYFEEKFKVMENDANIVKFSDHVVHAYINTERPDLKSIQPCLIGCEEGDRGMIHFLVKEDTEKLNKVLRSVDANPYMVLLGTIIGNECYTEKRLKEWMKLKYDKEMGEVLGLLGTPAQQLVGILENSGGSKLVALLDSVSRETSDLLEQHLKDQQKSDD